MLSFSEIFDAYDMAGVLGPGSESTAYVNVADEKILVALSEEFCDDEEQLEEYEKALETGEWIELPKKLLHGIGPKYVFKFAAMHLSAADYEYVGEMFTHSRAYSKWREFLRGKGLINQWHQFEDEQEAKALKLWLEHNGIPFSEEETQN